MKTLFIAAFILGIGLGLMAGYQIGVVRATPPPPAAPTAAVDASQWQEKLRQSDAALAEAYVEISRLRNRAAQSAATAATPSLEPVAGTLAGEPAADEAAAAQAAAEARREAWRTERREAMISNRMQLFANRLTLTADQQADIRALLDDPQTAGDDPRQRIESALAAVATPDQWQAYQQLVEQELQVRAETAANVQLSRLSLMLNLDEPQKQAVFEALYNQYYERQVSEPDRGMGGQGMGQPQVDSPSLSDRLRAVLSADQLQVLERARSGG
jgi:hypothetical protein